MRQETIGRSKDENLSNPEEKKALAILNEVYRSIKTTIDFHPILDLEKMVASKVKGFQKVVFLDVSPTSGAGHAKLRFVTEEKGIIDLYFTDPVGVRDKDGGWKGPEVTLHKEGKVSPSESTRILKELQAALETNSSLST